MPDIRHRASAQGCDLGPVQSLILPLPFALDHTILVNDARVMTWGQVMRANMGGRLLPLASVVALGRHGERAKIRGSRVTGNDEGNGKHWSQKQL